MADLPLDRPVGVLVKTTCVDFPGHLAGSFFLKGCNLRCPYCYNRDLVLGFEEAEEASTNLATVEELFTHLERRQGILTGLTISGGEPLLNPYTPVIIKKARELGYLIKLDTNGSNPGVVRDLVGAGLVDFIAMDVKAPWAKYGVLTGLAESPAEKVQETMSVIVASGLPHQFRTTRVTPLLTDDDCAEIERQIPVGSPFKWQTFIPDNALDPALRK